MTGIIFNDAPTWLALTLPKINDNTTLTSKTVFAFEFHPFVILSSECLAIVHSAFVEQNQQQWYPVYAEPPESDFLGGSKSSDIYLFGVITLTLFDPKLEEEMYYLIQHL